MDKKELLNKSCSLFLEGLIDEIKEEGTYKKEQVLIGLRRAINIELNKSNKFKKQIYESTSSKEN